MVMGATPLVNAAEKPNILVIMTDQQKATASHQAARPGMRLRRAPCAEHRPLAA